MKSRKEEASEIINNSAITSASAAAALAQTSFSGLDNALILPVIVSMIINLVKLYDFSIEKAAATALAGEFLKPAIGSVMATKALIGWVPIIGNAVNASLTFNATKIIGWAIYTILEEGKDIREVKEDEIKIYIKHNKKIK